MRDGLWTADQPEGGTGDPPLSLHGATTKVLPTIALSCDPHRRRQPVVYHPCLELVLSFF